MSTAKRLGVIPTEIFDEMKEAIMWGERYSWTDIDGDIWFISPEGLVSIDQTQRLSVGLT